MIKRAIFVKRAKGFADGRVYRLDPPHEGYEYVVSSAIKHGWAHETMIFGSDKDGNPADWMDLACVRGSTDHGRCLHELGYNT